MTLAELQIARGHLIDRALRHNSEDDWRDLEGVEHEIRELRLRDAQARLVDFHQQHYGAQPEDEIVIDAPFTFGDPLPPFDEAR